MTHSLDQQHVNRVQLGPWSAIVNLPHNRAYSDQGIGILYYADIYKTEELVRLPVTVI